MALIVEHVLALRGGSSLTRLLPLIPCTRSLTLLGILLRLVVVDHDVTW